MTGCGSKQAAGRRRRAVISAKLSSPNSPLNFPLPTSRGFTSRNILPTVAWRPSTAPAATCQKLSSHRSLAISTPRHSPPRPFCRLWNAYTIASPSKSCAAALAVPVLPKHRHQTAFAGSRSRDHRAIGPRIVPRYRAQRNFALIAFHQRLSVLRAAGAKDERSVRPAKASAFRSPVCT